MCHKNREYLEAIIVKEKQKSWRGGQGGSAPPAHTIQKSSDSLAFTVLCTLWLIFKKLCRCFLTTIIQSNTFLLYLQWMRGTLRLDESNWGVSLTILGNLEVEKQRRDSRQRGGKTGRGSVVSVQSDTPYSNLSNSVPFSSTMIG